MTPVTIDLKYGPMVVTVELTGDGNFQRIARYSLVNHPKLFNKVLTNKGKPYKTERGATKEAEKYITYQLN